MKTTLPFLLLMLVGLLAGCKKKFVHFYVDYTTEAVIPSTLGTFLPFSIQTPNTVTNSTYEFENHDTRKEKIESIFLKSLKLTITAPDGETFSFLSSADLYISAPNVDEVRIAYLASVPDSATTTLALDLDDVDLQEYIKADKFKLRLKVVSDETIPEDIHIDIYSNFLVDAKLIRFKK